MKLMIFTTGGTIASVQSRNGLQPGLFGYDLLKMCPDLMGFEHDIDVVDVMSKDSSNIFSEDWLVMAQQVRAHASGCGAAVILHGTDTMAWTAAALSYLLNDVPIPIVLTGSMMTADIPGNDVADNIFAAVQFAVQLAMYRRRGVAIAFDDVLIHGPRAYKVDSRRKHAFVSVDYPLLGSMKDKGTHKVAWLSAKIPDLSTERPWGEAPELEKNIALLPIFPGMPSSTLNAVLDAGTRAVVLEGYGLGGMPFVDDELMSAVKRGVDAGAIFIMRSQAVFGGTDLRPYEVGRRVAELGVLSARDMTREALMVKMMLSLPLCRGKSSGELEFLLNTNMCDEVLV